MIVIWGNRLYGKVDQVPGRCHVATRFFHLYFIPLIPLGSYVVGKGYEEEGLPIDLSAKSVCAAWMRASFVIMSVVGGFMALANAADPTLLSLGIGLLAFGVAGGIAANTNAGLNQASYERAVELCDRLGIDDRGDVFPLDLVYGQISEEEARRRREAHLAEVRRRDEQAAQAPQLTLAEAAARARAKRESARLGR